MVVVYSPGLCGCVCFFLPAASKRSVYDQYGKEGLAGGGGGKHGAMFKAYSSVNEAELKG